MCGIETVSSLRVSSGLTEESRQIADMGTDFAGCPAILLFLLYPTFWFHPTFPKLRELLLKCVNYLYDCKYFSIISQFGDNMI